MAQRLGITACTAALVALLEATLTQAYGTEVDVREAGKKDFDDQGQLVLKKVAVRVRFGDSAYGQVRDVTRTTLNAGLQYQVICRHQSLRSEEEMRSRTLSLCECVLEQLAGARLKMPDGSLTEPLLMKGVVPVSDAYGPVEDCFGVTLEVSGYAQYTGVNSQPNIQAVVS